MRPRTQIFIAIIGGCFAIFSAIILAPHWSKYFFPKQYLAQEKLDPSKTTNTKVVIDTVNRPSGKREEKEGVDDIKITKIELCPRNFKIPSYFYFEVNNSGSKTIKNLTVTVNLGKASYAYFDITKNLKLTTLTDSNDKSFLKIACPEIKENENIGIYLLISQPFFEDILIHADNLTFDKRYSYSEYLNSSTIEESNWFPGFLLVMLALAIIAFAIFFTIVIMYHFSKIFFKE